MKRCKHAYRLISYSGIKGSFECSQCAKIVSRGFTKKERAAVKKRSVVMQKRAEDTHKVYHAWAQLVAQHKGNPSSLMDAAEDFHKQYSGQTFLITVDDKMHMSSQMLVITHETEDSFMGITVTTLTQADTQVHECFLYPHSIDNLANALATIKWRTYKRSGEPPLDITY